MFVEAAAVDILRGDVKGMWVKELALKRIKSRLRSDVLKGTRFFL